MNLNKSFGEISKNRETEQSPNNLGFLKKIWGKILKLFSFRKRANEPIVEPEKLQSSNMDDVLLDSWNLVKDSVPFTIDIEQRLAPGIESHVRTRGKYFFVLGFENGVKGLIHNVAQSVEIARGEARHLVEYVKAVSLGKKQALESALNVNREILKDEKIRYDNANDYLERITHYYQNEPRSFARPLGWFYLVIAIILIGADIPLAQKLTSEGFQLDEQGKISWLLVAGLALCSVYIKIYYDEYIATPLGTSVLQFKGIPGIGKKKPTNQNEPISENEKNENETILSKENSKVKREYWVKFIVKTSVLLFTFYTIRHLGIFRYLYINDNEREVLITFAQWMVDNKLINIENRGDQIAFALEVTRNAFIFITLIFPIIGGICLSLSLNIFRNRRWMKKADSDSNKKRDQYVVALSKVNSIERDFEDFKNIFEEWHGKDEGERHMDFFTQVFNAYFKLGYNTGFTQPDAFNANDEIYTQVEKMRRGIIARKINNIQMPKEEEILI
jgi:hypothetical protein